MLRSVTGESEPSSLPSDELTLRSLFDREEGKLLRYAYSLTGRRAVAEEIVQEVFLQLHARWDEIKLPEAWLIRCVRNRSFDYLKRAKREILHGDQGNIASAGDRSKPQGQSQASSMGDPPCPDLDAPDQGLIQMEANAALRNAIADLPTGDQELLKLKYFEGLKYREISERTGLSISNVGFRLHHLLKVLASRLPELGVEE